MYIRVVGTIRFFNNRRNINAGLIRVVTDPHEIFYHQLDVIKTHLLLTRVCIVFLFDIHIILADRHMFRTG